jgi:hypothetical protein
MRILLTKQGDEIIKSITEEEKERKLKEAEETIIKKRNELRLSIIKEDERLKRIITKEILIKQKLIPKNITDRYNDDRRQSLFVLPQFSLLASLDENSNPSFNNSIKLKSIIQNKSITNLKNKLIDDKVMKDKHTRIDETKFRTIYENHKIVDKLDQNLNYEINPENINLIKYLNKKEIISDKLIEKLNSYTRNKINKIDKICQMINDQVDHEKNINDYIKNHFTEIRSKNTLELKNNINLLGSQINHYSQIFDKYPLTIKSKERFKDLHIEIQNKYWKKYKADLLQRTSCKISQNSNTSSDIIKLSM